MQFETMFINLDKNINTLFKKFNLFKFKVIPLYLLYIFLLIANFDTL